MLDVRLAHLYKITDVMSGKFYIGKHLGETQDGYWGSGVRLKNYVKKYGKTNLKYEILLIGQHSYVLEIENKYVTLDFIKANPDCLNLQQGGEKGNLKFPMTNATKEKISKARKGIQAWNKGMALTEEQKIKLRKPKVNKAVENKTQFKKGLIPWNKGIKSDPEVVKRMALSKKGKPSPRKGKILTEATKQKIRDSLKNRPPITKEAIEKIKAANLGRKHTLVTCPHCNKTGGVTAMPRWHFDNCKNRS